MLSINIYLLSSFVSLYKNIPFAHFAKGNLPRLNHFLHTDHQTCEIRRYRSQGSRMSGPLCYITGFGSERVNKHICTSDIMLHLPHNFDSAKNNAIKYYAGFQTSRLYNIRRGECDERRRGRREHRRNGSTTFLRDYPREYL